MRKLYLFNMITLDGFFEGKEPWDLGWHNVDAEFNTFAVEQLESTGLLLFGRKTYEGMAQYWSSDQANNDDPVVTKLMNLMPKIVASRTMTEASWNNTILLKENIADEISKLKSLPGKDIGLFGSADLASSLSSVIDEYRIIIAPVVLGSGTPLFKTAAGMVRLQTKNVRTFNNGNILIYYTPLNR
ncbi:MAG: dihydrofolate reductase family protein [Bacteroidota bacterium]